VMFCHLINELILILILILILCEEFQNLTIIQKF
jgi:hypothetical protein